MVKNDDESIEMKCKLSWPYIFKYLNKILLNDGSWLAKTNVLLNLLKD